MKKLLSALLALLMVFSAALTASAEEGNVVYSGDAGSFIFQPGSEYSPTDLFPDFKNVMPGDSLTQAIQIRNDASNKVKIKVYMRALGAHADSQAFLSQLQLQVEQNGDSILFQAPADQTAQLTDWVLLGTVYSGGTIDLDVTLHVPVELDDQFSNAVGYLDWQFMVEEYPVEPQDPKPPQTGDETPLGLYVGILVGSAVILVILIILLLKKKKKDEEK